MGQFTAYLVKEGFSDEPRYVLHGSTVVENLGTVFDEGVTTLHGHALEAYMSSRRQRPKFIVQCASNPHAYLRRSHSSKRPWWSEFWDIREEVAVQSADLLVVRQAAGRIFLLTHGQGRHLANPHALVHDFGLRATLSMIDPEQIKATDIFTPSEVGMSTRKQAGRNTQIAEYDIDVFQTLLKAVSGKCHAKYKDLLTSVHGTDSVKFSFSGSVAELDTRLELLLSRYQSEDYRSAGFAWIDNFRQVKDPELLLNLNSALEAAVNARDRNLILTFPDRFDAPLDAYFSYKRVSRGHSDSMFPTLEIENYFGLLDQLGRPVSVGDLKNHCIAMVDYGTGLEMGSFSLYNCVYFEIKSDGKSYFIESGIWYRVSPRFMKDIGQRLKPLIEDPWELGMPFRTNNVTIESHAAKCSKEMIFNTHLAEHLNTKGKAELLDTKLISVHRNKIEICDVLFKDEAGHTFLIHNKFKYGASALSHLFSQGLVSLETLLDGELRKKANEKITQAELRLPDSIETRGAALSVVYGIISRREASGDFRLPLFSLINLEHFATAIRRLGFGVRISYIEILRNG